MREVLNKRKSDQMSFLLWSAYKDLAKRLNTIEQAPEQWLLWHIFRQVHTL
ncbi:MAG: hypothetical protein QG564_1743 [Campylobacterota bacterium]|nr:hypothetical protein [Campylobacterota bacterium]